MRRALTIALTLAVALPAAAAPSPSGSIRCEARRVRISIGFGGAELLFFGEVPRGTQTVVVEVEAPGEGGLRLMEKGRVGPFWLGVRQYELHGVPGLYKVLLHCPEGNVLQPCRRPTDLAWVNRVLAGAGELVGPEAIVARAHVEVLQGEADPQARRRLFEGLWRLNGGRGLYEVLDNAVRLNERRQFYGRIQVPASAPEGKYAVKAFFLSVSEEAFLGTAETELFVRRTGIVAWLSRLARRRALTYGVVTVLVALAAGWLAGAIFRRQTSH